MPATIRTVVTEQTREGDPTRLVFCASERELSESELALRPVGYPALVEVLVALLELVARVIPDLVPGQPLALGEERLLRLLRRAAAEVALDPAWEERRREEAERQTAALGAFELLRRLRAAAPGGGSELDRLVTEEREAILAADNLTATLAAATADGFLDRDQTGGRVSYCLPGLDATRVPTGYCLDVLQRTVVAHLKEVGSWGLPLPPGERLLDLARDHARLLAAASVQANSMLRAAAREALEDRLAELTQGFDARREKLLRLLLEACDLPIEPPGVLDSYRAAERLEPALIAPTNVALALRRLAEAGTLAPCRHDDEDWYCDPALIDEAAADPARRAVMEQLLGRELRPRPTTEAPSAAPSDLKSRLMVLRELLDEGLIDQADYQRKKAELLDQL